MTQRQIEENSTTSNVMSPSTGAETSVPSYSLSFFSRFWIQGQLISRVVTVFV